MRTIILIWLLALIYCFLVTEAHAGANFTNLSDAITILGVDSPGWSSSSPIDNEFRAKLIEKINAIQKQFEEAEKASQIGLSKERLREIEQQAIEVLRGATIICKSEIIN